MADGSTTLGGGWDQVPAGVYAENALRILLAGGTFTGEALITELKRLGFGARGPMYLAPGQHGPGAPPMYALGAPHDYAALDDGKWDLIGFDPASATVTAGATLPSDTPASAPPPEPDAQQFAAELFAELEAIHNGLSDLAGAVTKLSAEIATVNAAGVKVHL